MPVSVEAGAPAIASWSGGKDSCLACYKAIQQGYRIKTLLNFVSRESKRGCFHGIEGALLRLQAARIGIPLVQYETSPDMEKYEGEFKDAVNGIRGTDVETMVFGDIYLLEHESWIARVCADLKIRPLEPLWDIPAEKIINEFIDLGFKTVIVSCKADVMGKEFLGRVMDKPLVKELIGRGICPCGEHGEFHTLVVDGPMFSSPIRLLETEPLLKEGFWEHWFLDIKRYA